MRKKKIKPITLKYFLRKIKGSFTAGDIPLIHPVSGKKIYLPMWYTGKVIELVFTYRPCPIRKGHLYTFQSERFDEGISIFKLRVHPDVYSELPKKTGSDVCGDVEKKFDRSDRPVTKKPPVSPEKELQTAILILHHDDGCDERLIGKDGGHWCPRCRLYPDLQSKQLFPYCPSCNVILNKMVCRKCGVKFKIPR